MISIARSGRRSCLQQCLCALQKSVLNWPASRPMFELNTLHIWQGPRLRHQTPRQRHLCSARSTGPPL